MIGRWLARRRDCAAFRWHVARATYGEYSRECARERTRFHRWDDALDLWTGNGGR